MTPYEAVFNRRSVRRFEQTPLSEDLLNKIKLCAAKLEGWRTDLKYQFRIISGEKRAERLKVGAFGAAAPHYLVFLVEDKPGVMFDAGMLAEYMVLYLTTKGVATCYQGGARLSPKRIPRGYRLAMVIAFGNPRGRLYRDSAGAKRQPLTKLCLSPELAGEENRLLLKAARLAPSALNRQPWRMLAAEDKIHLYVKREFGARRITDSQLFDMGIMYCHMDIAADEQWFAIERRTDASAPKTPRKDWLYLTTVSRAD